MRQQNTPSKLTLAHALMVLAGLMTFVLVSAVLNDRRETSQVLVATVGAPAGSEASTLKLEPMDVPVNHPLSSQFAAVGSVQGSERIARDVEAGQPLLSNDLLAPERRIAVRTFAVPVTDLVLRGLGLRVSDRVDIIGQDDEGNVYYVVTDLVVSSLSALGDESGFATSTDSFVTIEVADDEALALSAALREANVDVVRSTGAEAVKAPVRVAGPEAQAAGPDENAAAPANQEAGE
jgi:hypothetical protein